LGDKRLNQRCALLLERFESKPSLSIPGACKGWGETQAFFYTWGDRELINFQPLDSSSETVQEE
jgi:hypothetical protein